MSLGDQLVFTSDRGAATGEDTYLWTGREFSDLFTVDPSSSTVQEFNQNLNTVDNDGTAAFSADGNLMVFTRCSAPAKRTDAFCGLYASRRSGDGWAPAEKLNFVTANANYMHPALSADGKRLVFSAKLDDGWGGYDLYTSELGADGNWSAPDLMNRAINTEGNEQFPTLDGDTLYFSSDGLEGLGGLDIFRTWPLEDGRYNAPKNLRLPINSGADDFAYTIVKRNGTGIGSTTEGYFSSSRAGGSGSDDIYAYTKTILPPPPPDPTPVVYKNVLDVTVVEKIFEDPTNPASRVLGVRPVPNTTIVARVGEQSREVTTDEEGQLSLVLVDNQSYEFRAERARLPGRRGPLQQAATSPATPRPPTSATSSN